MAVTLCSCKVRCTCAECHPEQIVGDPQVLKRVAKIVSSHLAEGEARLKAEQACFLPCTDDSIPVNGEIPGVKGGCVATGAAMSEVVVDGQATIVDLTRFSPPRFVGRKRKVWLVFLQGKL
ncbi:hypothetical protein NC652_013897 [Populus alba x Populus x berolinensis]|nr:hypothetical protein NC652_013890 [Populus alba x Populus x berolinensis]KAJ6930183.1 hypothetical protein NC652_013891 [Populus alba x Populus x berolinensis]KAJ6930189.1 hypothetical protein NC652_013897 [Populus alba x Populus x berolinensis]